jgi:hypothetical protein
VIELYKVLHKRLRDSFVFFQQGNKRWMLWLLGIFLIGGLLQFALATWVSWEVTAQIRASHGSTSSIEVSLWHRSISIGHLQWFSDGESTNRRGYSVRARNISVDGIHLIDLLFQHQVIVESLKIDSATIEYDESTKVQMNGNASNRDYQSFFIREVTFNQVDCLIKTDTIIQLSAQFNGTLSAVSLAFTEAAVVQYQVKAADMLVTNVVLHREEGMYGGSIARLHIQTEKNRIEVDSALLIPNFGKFEFAHRLGKQTDRITLIVPKLTLEGVNFNTLADSMIIISKIKIDSFNIVAFRDKRVPSRDETYVPLPMESFLAFPYQVQIDSVVINHSMVTVEEIPEDRSISSRITFEDIHATLTHFYNRPTADNLKPALLHATGLLMGEGQIDAQFTLPLERNSTYNTTGSVKKLYFSKLNPALEPLANIRMESGYLNELTFNFNYSDLISTGILEIDYQDLQLTALGKDHHSANEVRTWLLNAFVKNDRNHSLASAKHQGDINIPRDRQRFIFNIWWKSIRDGLKSIVMRTGKITKRKSLKNEVK